MTTCPICRSPNPPGVLRCGQCGADFHDPDVAALAPGDSTELPSASLGEAGALSSDRFMGVSLTGLLEGRALALLGLFGGIGLVAAFLAPVSPDYTGWLMPWAAVSGGGPELGLVYPMVGAAAGFWAFAARGVQPWIRAAVLAGVALFGLFVTLVPLGGYAAGPVDLMVVYTAGMVLCGLGAALRMYYPQLMEARHILAAGAAVVLVGMVLPLEDVRDHLPAEFAWRMWRGDEVAEASALSAYLDGSGTDAMVQLVSWWGLLPLVLIPAALALAWPRPNGVWDRGGTGLRPIAWALVLFVPLTWFLYLFNLMGWDDLQWVRYKGHAARFEDFTMTVTVGRAKIAVASAVYALWAVFAGIVLYARLRLRNPANA